MCIIAYKPLDTAFMPKSILKECFKNNPDGSGFMFSANGKVYIRKGFMDFDSFWNALSQARNKYGEKIPYVMHFRISTQAGINQQCCHPYPLSSDMDNLKKLSIVSRIGIAHNGVIHLTSDASVKDYNDTMKFITDYATLLIKKVDWWKNPNIATALEQLCGSKLAILGSDNHCELIGDFIEDKGCFYSNSTYLKPKIPKIQNYYYGDYDNWEWYKNPKTKKYDFSEAYCPLWLDADDSYCSNCSKCNKCQSYQDYQNDYIDFQDYDDFGLVDKVVC